MKIIIEKKDKPISVNIFSKEELLYCCSKAAFSLGFSYHQTMNYFFCDKAELFILLIRDLFEFHTPSYEKFSNSFPEIASHNYHFDFLKDT